MPKPAASGPPWRAPSASAFTNGEAAAAGPAPGAARRPASPRTRWRGRAARASCAASTRSLA
eukprot:1060304-Lingulodinium_polyedra.AAC.1